MPLLFASTLFVSAFLLFLVQPMIGKMILPRLGGTPAVWATCMVFFQAALLAGYGYTHSVSTYLPVRRQLFVHGGLLLLPLILLVPPLGPFGIGNWEPPPQANPIFSVLWLLTIVVGLPFFVVATSAPLLQKWFGSTGHASARDPYFLYGASNLGSMLALIAYPLWVEQGFDLDRQSTLWAFGYGLFLLGTVVCGFMVWAAPPSVQLAGAGTPPVAQPPAQPSTPIERTVKKCPGPKLRLTEVSAPAPATTAHDPDRLTNWRRLRWIALAAAPSSLMLGVITFVTTDIAAVPLFWVIPLALYLLSFILVFMRWPVEWLGLPHRLMLILHPVALLLLALVALQSRYVPTWLLLSAHVLAFFLTTMVCHGELARDRPSTRKLTEFYLWMSVGGVVGGLFNALLAPLIFKSYAEYPLVLVMACALRPPLKIFNRWFGFDREDSALQERLLDVGYAICLGLFSFALIRISKSESLWGKGLLEGYLIGLVGKAGLVVQTAQRVGGVLTAAVVYGIPILVCIGFAGRPLRFGLSLFAMLLVSYLLGLAEDKAIYTGRSFFGVRRVEVEEDEDNNTIYHVLIHGGINHGAQIIFPEAARSKPITYFHPKGPIGELFTHFKKSQELRQPEDRQPFGVIGLGIGTLASYGLNGQHVVFYEIDPAVRDLSLPPPGQKNYFYYLQDALKRGPRWRWTSATAACGCRTRQRITTRFLCWTLSVRMRSPFTC